MVGSPIIGHDFCRHPGGAAAHKASGLRLVLCRVRLAGRSIQLSEASRWLRVTFG